MDALEQLQKEGKICCKCKLFKNFSEYHILTKRGEKSVQYSCKECTSKYKKERYWNNRDIELVKVTKSRTKPENLLQRKGYYESKKDEYRERYYKYMQDETKRKLKKERGKEYEKKNAEIISQKKKINNQKEEVKIRKRKNHHKRKNEDMNYVMKRRLRCRLRHIIKYLGDKKYKLKSAIDLLGCDMNFFNSHIEGKFVDGMCWERISEIDIDHIIPCVSFDLTQLEEQKKCFHWSNLQPLWHIHNLKKGTKIL